jgi:hypothetical protein
VTSLVLPTILPRPASLARQVIVVIKRVPLEVVTTAESRVYLLTKPARFEHLIDMSMKLFCLVTVAYLAQARSLSAIRRLAERGAIGRNSFQFATVSEVIGSCPRRRASTLTGRPPGVRGHPPSRV